MDTTMHIAARPAPPVPGHERSGRSLIMSRAETWWVAGVLALIPATAGTARGLVVPGLRLSEALTLGLGVWCVFRFGRTLRLSGPAIGGVVAFAVITVVTGLIAAVRRPDLPDSMVATQAFGVVQYVILFVVALNLARVPRLVDRFAVILIWTAGAVGVLAVAQLAGFGPALDLGTALTGNPDIANPVGWKAPRSTGVFFAWHALGGYLALVLVLGAAMVSGTAGTRGARLRLWIPLSAVLAGLLCTLTFVPIAIGVAGAAIVLLARGKLGHLLAAGCAGLLAVFATPVGAGLGRRLADQAAGGDGIPQTLAYRFEVWHRDYLPLILQNPWTGHGPTVDTDGIFAYPESMYIAVLLRGGILLLVALLVICTVGLGAAARGARTAAPGSTLRNVATATAVIIPLLLCAMVIHPYLSDAGASQLFFVFLGFSSAAAVTTIRRRRRTDG